MNRQRLVMLSAIQLALCCAVASAQNQTTAAAVSENGCMGFKKPTLIRRQSTSGAETATHIPPCPTSPVATKPNIEFHGLNAIAEADALYLFREKGVFSVDRQSAETATAAAAALKENLIAEGYANAEVHGFADQKGTFRLFVNEGTQLPLSEVRFEGNRNFSTGELKARVTDCLSEVAGPNSYQREKLEWCERRVLNHIRSSGYLEAKLRNTVEVTKRGFVVSFVLDEGTLYRLGEIKIDGARTFTDEQVKAKLGLRKGEIAKGDNIAKWLFEDLKNMYGDLGFIQYTAEVDPTFKREQGLVDLKIEIDEGRQYSLQSITFVGDLIKGLNLVELLPLTPGNIYSQRLLRESIARLNEISLFETIDADRDVDMRTADEEALVEVVIKLRKRE